MSPTIYPPWRGISTRENGLGPLSNLLKPAAQSNDIRTRTLVIPEGSHVMILDDRRRVWKILVVTANRTGRNFADVGLSTRGEIRQRVPPLATSADKWLCLQWICNRAASISDRPAATGSKPYITEENPPWAEIRLARWSGAMPSILENDVPFPPSVSRRKHPAPLRQKEISALSTRGERISSSLIAYLSACVSVCVCVCMAYVGTEMPNVCSPRCTFCEHASWESSFHLTRSSIYLGKQSKLSTKFGVFMGYLWCFIDSEVANWRLVLSWSLALPPPLRRSLHLLTGRGINRLREWGGNVVREGR